MDYREFFERHLKAAVKWRARGEGLAKCPLHQDDKASLSVNRESGLWFCHACNIGGTAREFAERLGVTAPGGNRRSAESVFDYRDESGGLLYQVVRFAGKQFRQRRPDGKGDWIWNLQGVRRVPYRLPELLKSEGEVFIVEGEKDVESLRARGLTATCNAGGAGKWHRDFGEHLRGRTCILIADNDEPGRRHVAEVARELAAYAAKVIDLGAMPGSGPHGDVSDWLAARHTIAELRALVEKAKQSKRPLNGASGAPPRSVSESAVDYFEHDGRIVHRRLTRNGIIEVHLTNFTARIARELEHDDGVTIAKEFEIEATVAGQKQTVTVSASEFASLSWVTAKLGASAIVGAGQGTKDHTRAAIQFLSEGHGSEKLYAHTGWRQIEGEWVYLHGGGAIGADRDGNAAAVRTKLPSALAEFVLPEPPSDPCVAVKASLGILELAPARLAAPGLAAVYRAVLGEADFAVHIAGASGVFKSEFAALLQRHFGRGFDREHLPMNWSSTANANEGVGFAAKDSMMTIDDYVPLGSSQDRQRQRRDADRLLRAAGNRQGRNRMNADLSVREGHAPRCVFVSTGEDVPTGYSLGARLFKLEVGKGDIDQVKLTACQHDAAAGLYAEAMAAYLRWLSPRLARVRKLMAERKPDFRAMEFKAGAHARTPGMVADLFIGFACFVAFAVECGALTPADADSVSATVWRGLHEAAGEQIAHQQSEEPARRFLELLASALASGHAHVATLEGARPATDGGRSAEGDFALRDEPDEAQYQGSMVLGWRHHRGVWEACGPLVGWLNGDRLYLEPDAAYKVAAAMALDTGISVAPTTLWKRLREGGWIGERDEKRETLKVRKTIGGQRRAVICLRADALAGEVSCGSPDQPDQPDNDGAVPLTDNPVAGFWREICRVSRAPE